MVNDILFPGDDLKNQMQSTFIGYEFGYAGDAISPCFASKTPLPQAM